MHRMNESLVQYHLACIEAVCDVMKPDFMTFAEDMSYNNGPMLSKGHFDTFLAPYYRRVVPELQRRGIPVLVDTDGDLTQMIPWLKSVGVQGILPLERQAGVDVNACLLYTSGVRCEPAAQAGRDGLSKAQPLPHEHLRQHCLRPPYQMCIRDSSCIDWCLVEGKGVNRFAYPFQQDLVY